MPHFRYAHATHPDWRLAVDRVLAQLDAQNAQASFAIGGALGILYVTDPLAERLGEIRDTLISRLPGLDWVGASAQGVCSTDIEYQDEPALAVMICDLPGNTFRVFSGRARLSAASTGVGSPRQAIEAALVHADPATPDLPELLGDLALHTRDGHLFGGVVGGASGPTLQLASDVVSGGISGVAFGPQVMLRSRVTQGCSPLGPEHTISTCSSHYIQSLDGRPALDVLLDDLGVPAEARASRDGDEILRALPADRLARGLMVGLAPPETPRGFGFGDYLVRNLVGIDPTNRLLAVAATPQPGQRAVFCTRDQQAARADLVRICTDLREEVESESLHVLGAHYVTCVARGAHLFGAPGAELQLIAHNLGEVPLVGFFANGEIAGDRLYGYTGVLTLFVERRTGLPGEPS
jgi:small ligand-binding sensory domain FIST